MTDATPKLTREATVLILMGSESDLPAVLGAVEVLDSFAIPVDVQVASAHRSPSRVAGLVKAAEEGGVKVLIAAAGMAAHLAGVLASKTILPVIGIPIDSPPLNGVDSLYSTAMMPPGIPVATVGIGKAGAKNAGHLAAEIIALGDPALRRRLVDYRNSLGAQTEEANRRVQQKLGERKA